MGFQYFENSGDILSQPVYEEKTVCNQYESGRVVRESFAFSKIKLSKTGQEKDSCVCRG